MNTLLQIQILLWKCIWLIAATNKVCYPPYGCFNDNHPHNYNLVQLPEDPSELNTQYLLYTRTQKDTPVYLDPFKNETIHNSVFDGNRQTIFLLHGFFESPKRFYVKAIVDELLTHDDMNVIVVDWSRGAAFPYHQAVGNTRILGAQLSHMLEVLHAETSIPYSKFHLIGFSLGAHVSGYAGRNLRRKGIALGRITGLDPAGPYFEFKHPDARLDKTDADFVDVIHSDTKTLIIKGFGSIQPMGDVDFYPNGGYRQPGCLKPNPDPIRFGGCNHFRAAIYFNESINGKLPFNAYPCKNYEDFDKGLCTKCPDVGCPSMGYGAIKKKGQVSGSFYSKTNGDEPFGGYHYALTFTTGDVSGATLIGKVTVTITTNSGISKVIPLDRYRWYAGTNNTFIAFMEEDVSDMHKIKVYHNNYFDRWRLLSVVVKPMWKDETFTACYNRWLYLPHDEVKFHKGKPGFCPTASQRRVQVN